MTVSKMQAFITDAIVNDLTIAICTYGRVLEVTPKTRAKFAKAGASVFRLDDDGSCYVARGKKWDCIDYCTLRAYR